MNREKATPDIDNEHFIFCYLRESPQWTLSYHNINRDAAASEPKTIENPETIIPIPSSSLGEARYVQLAVFSGTEGDRGRRAPTPISLPAGADSWHLKRAVQAAAQTLCLHDCWADVVSPLSRMAVGKIAPHGLRLPASAHWRAAFWNEALDKLG